MGTDGARDRNTDAKSKSPCGGSWILNPFGDAAAVALARWTIRRRWLVIAATLLFALAAASGGRHLGFSTNYRVFFSEANPQLKSYEALQDIYTKDDNISFVLRPAEGTVFTPQRLVEIRKLTEAAWQIPFSTRVDSITNFQHSHAEGDELIVADLVPKKGTPSAAQSDAIARIAIAEPLMVNRLIAPDRRTTSINVTVTLPEKTEDEVPAVMAHARQIAKEFGERNPDIRVGITGSAALNNAFVESSFRDLSTLIPAMYVALLIVMVVLLRSASGTVATLGVIGLSAASAMGLAGWAGFSITPPSAIAPTIILTIAVADSIHILVTMLAEMRRGTSKHDALVESMRINFQPVFLTSITTAIGFLSLNFSDAPPFRDLGNITATGTMVAWLYSILFLPALMAVLPVRVKPRPNGTRSAMDRLADFVIGRRRPLLVSMIALVVVLAAFVPRIELNDQFVKYFAPSLAFRADTDFAQEHLSGIYQAQWSLPAPGSGAVSDPDYLAKVEAFSQWLRGQKSVVHVQTLTDIFRRLNKNMHADDPDWYRLPAERDLAAQYLLLFEMSLPYGLDLNNQINVDKSAIRLIATLENLTTNELRALDRNAQVWLTENLASASGQEASGPFVMFAYIAKRNIVGMLSGTAIAFVLISLTLTLALRSLRLGLVSLVPNLVPAFMAFGIWAIFVAEVGLASSVVTATSLGIIVDATVHFLSKYLRARRDQGADAQAAVRYAFSTVGTALWVTSAILVAGFAILSLSTFQINATLGLLTAITLVCALIADFLLLPPLLMAIDRGKRSASPAADPISQPAE